MLVPVLALLLSAATAVAEESEESSLFVLRDGSIVVGRILKETDLGYLIRTDDGETRRILFADIVDVGERESEGPVEEVPKHVRPDEHVRPRPGSEFGTLAEGRFWAFGLGFAGGFNVDSVLGTGPAYELARLEARLHDPLGEKALILTFDLVDTIWLATEGAFYVQIAAMYQRRFPFTSLADTSVAAGLQVAPYVAGPLGSVIIEVPVRAGFDISPPRSAFEVGVYARLDAGWGHADDGLYYANWATLTAMLEMTVTVSSGRTSR